MPTTQEIKQAIAASRANQREAVKEARDAGHRAGHHLLAATGGNKDAAEWLLETYQDANPDGFDWDDEFVAAAFTDAAREAMALVPQAAE